MLFVLYSKINYKPSNKSFPLKTRAFFKNINTDWTTFSCKSTVFTEFILPLLRLRPKSGNICDKFV